MNAFAMSLRAMQARVSGASPLRCLMASAMFGRSDA